MSKDQQSSSRPFLRGLLLVIGTLSIVFVVPFLQPVLAGGLFAYLIAPINERLSRRLGGTAATVVTIFLAVVAVLGPLLLVVSVAAEQAGSAVRGAGVPTGTVVESTFRELLGTNTDPSKVSELVSRTVAIGIQGLLGSIIGIIGGIPAFVVGAVIFLFTLFYLLRDGDRLVGWLRTVAPLDPKVADELITRTDDLLWSAVIGNVVVAGAQAILTVISFLVIGFDNLVFWGVLTFVLSLLPVIGASVVWIPVVIYLAVTGSVPAAVGLLLYGTVIISGSDNFIRPLAMQRGANLNPGVLILGIFGGVAVFGFLGLFVGPVVFGLLKTILDLLVRERDVSRGDSISAPREKR